MHYFRRSRSGQVHSFMATLTCLRSVGTNLTLTCPFPKSSVCNLPNSGRYVTSVFQGLSLSRSVGWVGKNPGNEVGQSNAFSRNSTSLETWHVRPTVFVLKTRYRLKISETIFEGAQCFKGTGSNWAVKKLMRNVLPIRAFLSSVCYR